MVAGTWSELTQIEFFQVPWRPFLVVVSQCLTRDLQKWLFPPFQLVWLLFDRKKIRQIFLFLWKTFNWFNSLCKCKKIKIIFLMKGCNEFFYILMCLSPDLETSSNLGEKVVLGRVLDALYGKGRSSALATGVAGHQKASRRSSRWVGPVLRLLPQDR